VIEKYLHADAGDFFEMIGQFIEVDPIEGLDLCRGGNLYKPKGLFSR
jgi:hypothetical protein